jgi:hypothetical protein
VAMAEMHIESINAVTLAVHDMSRIFDVAPTRRRPSETSASHRCVRLSSESNPGSRTSLLGDSVLR